MICSRENSQVPSFIKIESLVAFGPPFWISEFWFQIRNRRPQNPSSTKFYPNQNRFCVLVRHFEFLNFEFRFIIGTPKKLRVPKFIQIELPLHSGLPYWDRHFEFLNFEFWFIICSIENLQVPSFSRIKTTFRIWSAIFNFWILISDS